MPKPYCSRVRTLFFRHCCSLIGLWLGLLVVSASAHAQPLCEPRILSIEVAQASAEPLSPPLKTAGTAPPYPISVGKSAGLPTGAMPGTSYSGKSQNVTTNPLHCI